MITQPDSQFHMSFQPKRVNYYYYHCKIQGHIMERCFKIHEYPPGFKEGHFRKYASSANNDDDEPSHTQETNTFS